MSLINAQGIGQGTGARLSCIVRNCAIALVAASAGAWLLAAAPALPKGAPEPGDLWVRNIVVVDGDGAPRIVMGTNDGGGHISFIRPDGTRLCQIASGADGASISLLTPDHGGPLVELTSRPVGGALYLSSGKPNAELNGEESVTLSIHNAQLMVMNRQRFVMQSLPLVPER